VSIHLSVCLSVLPINDYDDDCVEMAKHIEKHFSPLRSLVIPAMFAIGFVPSANEPLLQLVNAVIRFL